MESAFTMLSEPAESRSWIESILNPGSRLVQDMTSNWPSYRKILIEQTGENIYNDIQRTREYYLAAFRFDKPFSRLSEEEKSYWYNFASFIPAKLKMLNLKIRLYKDFCRTCLIPYGDIEKLAKTDYIRESEKNRAEEAGNKEYVSSFQDLRPEQRRFFIEMNHLIPVELKKAGYEILRAEEASGISDKMVIKLARAIHSRYQREIKKQVSSSGKKHYLSWLHNPGDEKKNHADDFDDLPEEIRHSNLDNAYHIPTKLLSIGYYIRPVEKGFKPFALALSDQEVEIMARTEHIRWCWDKILHGWFYGKARDSRKKIHPSIIPYEDLSEEEKDKDRELVRLIPALLKDIGYGAFPVNPDRISKLPYAIKPHSSLHRILEETRKINTQIRSMVSLTPEVEEMVLARNIKIEEAIKEVESSYNYAQHIQETYLPDSLYVRECFPESFILFMPKDVVGGDFYFFSKLEKLIIFAVADCTGHGIPGALLSTIGYGILDQAVNELGLTDPAEILLHLYTKIHRFLRLEPDGSGLSDDMDIILCLLDTKSNFLTYAGVRNPLYHSHNGEISEYKPSNTPVHGYINDDSVFSTECLKLQPGDTLYLCSDGYIDQFGGKNHKKYLSTRFKSLLQNLQNIPMTEQGDMLYDEIEKWSGENNEDQTDDILVIGIKI